MGSALIIIPISLSRGNDFKKTNQMVINNVEVIVPFVSTVIIL